MARNVDRKAAIRVGVAGRDHQALPVFNPPPAADAKRKPSALNRPMNVGRQRAAPQTDNQSTGVGGNDFRNSEIPFARR
jgi:hypothetical protein